MLSEKSVNKRGYIQKEFKMAVEYMAEMPEGQIYLIPVRLNNCLIPQQFSAFQWVDLHGQEGFEKIRQAIDFQINLRRDNT
jgi:hypothetical protein